MVAKISFFPVGNGDMTLIVLDSGRTILIDVNILCSADDPDQPDVLDIISFLRDKLNRDAQGRKYVDVFILSHPDKDHCLGLNKHFHLDAPENYSKADDKIFIREIWSSPMVFRRASKALILCDDAKFFNTEAKRRVQYYRDHELTATKEGDRIQIMGEDEDGKTDDLTEILVKVDELVTKVNGTTDFSMTARLLGPLPKFEDEKKEDALAKNRSSIILNFALMVGGVTQCQFLTGGDAEVEVWETLWENHKNTDWLKYHVLQNPHHCSWHSLSHDSWGKYGEQAKVSQDARSALAQTHDGALLIASCKKISANDSDPPCIRAKREYEAIAKAAGGRSLCTADSPKPLELIVENNGVRKDSAVLSPKITSPGLIGRSPLAHGEG
jgi:hypothetical protein